MIVTSAALSDLDASAWRSALEALPAQWRDVYFTPEYHGLHVANGDGDAVCAEVTAGASTLLVAGLSCTIPASGDAGAAHRWDLQTCNGYGGPVAATMPSPGALQQMWEEWREMMRASGGIAALFRLHPLLGNERLLPADAIVRVDRQTVYVDLRRGSAGAWEGATSQHRNMVRKAERRGERVMWDVNAPWDEFETLYGAAMERLGASPRLRFTAGYFAALRRLPHVGLAVLRDASGLVGGAVFLFGPVWAHYHLSARRADAGNDVMNCLLQAAIERAAQARLQGLLLGGGATPAEDDGLFRFKKAIGSEVLPFRIAVVVADQGAYDQLVREWAARVGRAPTWLLGYREPIG